MDQLSTIIGNLFALNPSAAPAGARGGMMNSLQPTAPAPAAIPQSVADSSPQAKVLATLQNRSTPLPQGGGPGGMAVGPLPDVKGKSKGSAFATGLSAGMNNAQNLSAAQSKAQQEQAAQNLKTMTALFTAQETARGNDIKADQAKHLGNYYDSMGEYYKHRNDGTDVDQGKNESLRQLALTRAATRAGLGDKALTAQMQSPIPSIAQAGKDEYARRKAAYDAEATGINDRFNASGKAVTPTADAVKTAAAGNPPPPPPAGGAPTPAGGIPAGGAPAPIPAGGSPGGAPVPSPTPAPPVDPATPPVAAPQTWKPIRNSKDGSMWLWNPATGEKKPAEAPSAPDPAASDDGDD